MCEESLDHVIVWLGWTALFGAGYTFERENGISKKLGDFSHQMLFVFIDSSVAVRNNGSLIWRYQVVICIMGGLQ